METGRDIPCSPFFGGGVAIGGGEVKHYSSHYTVSSVTFYDASFGYGFLELCW